MTSLSDEELVARFRDSGGRNGGSHFADELFKRHYARVSLWCFRIAGDREQATDLAQGVFAKAWVHLEHFRDESKFTTWLYMIARNHCFNSMQSRNRNPEEAVEPEQLELQGSIPARFDSALEQSQLVEIARGFMASELTPVESQAMTLHYVDGLPLDAVSRLLALDNQSGAKAYIVSAKRKLKTAVDRWKARTGAGGPGSKNGP
jgi:RNA polymerase sigma-70 factor, ECF subfamily